MPSATASRRRRAARDTAPQETNARIHIALAQVEQRLASLVTSVRQFNGHLQRLLREDGTDDIVFADVKRRTVSYLEEYVEGVERPHRRLVRHRAESSPSVWRRSSTGPCPAPTWLPSPAMTPDQRGWPSGQRHWQALRAWFSPEVTPRRP